MAETTPVTHADLKAMTAAFQETLAQSIAAASAATTSAIDSRLSPVIAGQSALTERLSTLEATMNNRLTHLESINSGPDTYMTASGSHKRHCPTSHIPGISTPVGAAPPPRTNGPPTPSKLQLGPFPFQMNRTNLIGQAKPIIDANLPSTTVYDIEASGLSKSVTLVFPTPTAAASALDTLRTKVLSWTDPTNADPHTNAHVLKLRYHQTQTTTEVKKALGALWTATIDAYTKAVPEGPKLLLGTHAPRRSLNLTHSLRTLELFTIEQPTPTAPFVISQNIKKIAHAPHWLTTEVVAKIITMPVPPTIHPTCA